MSLQAAVDWLENGMDYVNLAWGQVNEAAKVLDGDAKRKAEEIREMLSDLEGDLTELLGELGRWT